VNLKKVSLSKKVEMSDSVQKNIPLQYIIFKKLSSPIILAIWGLLYTVYLYVIQTIILAAYKFQCVGNISDISRYFYGLSFGTILIAAMLWMIDIVKNWRILIKCQLIQYFITSDPNLFRIDTLTVFPLLFFLAIWAIVPLPIVFRLLIIEILFVGYVHISGVNSLYIAIFKKIYYLVKGRNKKENSANELAKIFDDPELLKIFSTFANSGKIQRLTKSGKNGQLRMCCVNQILSNIKHL
jgi:hypothetical protein